MQFMVNTSPLAGTEGKFVTSRQIRDPAQGTADQHGAARS
jgi:GTP-binding protein